MELSSIENLAFSLLQPRPDILQTMAKSDGTIEISKVHAFYHFLSRQLEFVMAKREGGIVDAEVVKTVE